VYLNRFKTKLNNEEFRYEFLKAYSNKLSENIKKNI